MTFLRYIKTTSQAHVEHLLKYLAMRLAADFPKPEESSSSGASTSSSSGLYSGVAPGVEDLVIYVDSAEAGGMTEVGPDEKLQDVKEKHWRHNKPMELFYMFYSPKNK